MLLLIGPQNRREELIRLIEARQVRAYSELDQVTGEGATGKKLGTHAWPEKSCLIFTVVADEIAADLIAAIRDYHKSLYPGEGLKAFTLPVETEV